MQSTLYCAIWNHGFCNSTCCHDSCINIIISIILCNSSSSIVITVNQEIQRFGRIAGFINSHNSGNICYLIFPGMSIWAQMHNLRNFSLYQLVRIIMFIVIILKIWHFIISLTPQYEWEGSHTNSLCLFYLICIASLGMSDGEQLTLVLIVFLFAIIYSQSVYGMCAWINHRNPHHWCHWELMQLIQSFSIWPICSEYSWIHLETWGKLYLCSDGLKSLFSLHC